MTATAVVSTLRVVSLALLTWVVAPCCAIDALHAQSSISRSALAADGGRLLDAPNHGGPPRSALLAQRVAVGFTNLRVGQALAAITEQSHARLAYSSDDLVDAGRVSLPDTTLSMGAALGVVLADTRLHPIVMGDGSIALTTGIPPRETAVDSSGTLTGILVGREGGETVQYGTVVLLETGNARFTDAHGAFRMTRLVPGTYTLRARQIGYAPTDTTIQIEPAPAVTTVTVRLRRLPALLNLVKVQGRHTKGCVVTGIPDSAADPRLAAIFTQVRENVDRFQLLLEKYPFRYTRQERFALERRHAADVSDSTRSVDTVTYESRDRRPYRVGDIVYISYDAVGRRHRYMYLPTFRELADSAFLAAHCFSYGGTESFGGTGGSKLIRVDFRPARAIDVPDVEGSIYLDAERFVVRRAVFRLTKPEAADPPVLGLAVTTTFRELVPLVPVFDSVASEQRLAPVHARGHVDAIGLGEGAVPHDELITQSVVETDRLLGFAFESLAPGQQQAAAAGGPVASAPPGPDRAASGISTAAPPLLAGRVVDSHGRPVAGARVGLFAMQDSSVSDDSGHFSLAGNVWGPHMLWVHRLGFRPARVAVTASQAHARPVTIALDSAIAVLPTVLTTARVRAGYHDVGLDRRMRAGNGQFLTFGEIQQRHASKLSQLLQRLRGVRVWQNPLEYETTVEGTRGVGSCVSFVVDGIPQSVASVHDADNMIDASGVAAIEVYSSAQRPAELGGLEERPPPDPRQPPPTVDFNGQQCTLVAIWTRARLGLSGVDDPTAPSARPTGARARPVFPNVAMCEPEPAADTIDVPLYAILQSAAQPRRVDSAWSGYVDRVLAGLRGALVLPSDLPLPAFGYPFHPPPASESEATPPGAGPALDVAPAWSTVIAFTLDSSGGVRGLRIAASSLSGPADTSLLAAITEANAAHAFPAAPTSAHVRTPIRFDLIVSTARPDAAYRAAILGRISMPLWALRRPASLADVAQPDLTPDAGPIHIGADSAMLEFVVGENGRAAMSTVRAVNVAGADTSASQRAFFARLIRKLPEFQFKPALVGACPVPEIITQGFSWKIRMDQFRSGGP